MLLWFNRLQAYTVNDDDTDDENCDDSGDDDVDDNGDGDDDDNSHDNPI